MSISVLMSVYKSEKADYLARALRSVWTDQTLKPDEIVLVEDGPLGDELIRVIIDWKSLLRERLVLLRNDCNLGLTKSLNKGLSVVKSDFIARMDSDDISHPLRFERQVRYLKEHPEVSVLGGALQEFDAEHEDLGIRHYPLTNKDVKSSICKASPLAHPTVMMRRFIFDNGLRYDERYRTSQDLALWYDVLCKGYQIGNIKDVTIYFRREGDVFKRRNKRKNTFIEFKIYVNGISRLYGRFSWRYIYPIARLMFRLLPVSVVRKIYGSNIRKRILE